MSPKTTGLGMFLVVFGQQKSSMAQREMLYKNINSLLIIYYYYVINS